MRNYYSNVKVSEIFKDITLEDQQKYRDNLAFNLDLQGFMKELRKAFRGVVFTPQGDMRKVYMHMPNDPYVMGYIGYGDFQTTTKAMQSSYVVSSRHIMNMKYADHNDQYYMAMSINLDTAVRNAKKYLRPLTTRDMALDEYNDMQRKSNDTESRASNAKNTAQSDLLARSNREKKIEYNPMLEYMRTLVKVGHEFTDKELESNLLTYFKLEDEHKVLLDKGINVSYVRIYEKYGKQVFDVAPIISKDRYSHIVGDITPYGKADVPEDIVGKVSMLSMVDNGHWVDDVGYRVDATMFYVTAKSNE
tara:strand:- start:179 stop:1093 length:915 start_codon:yes stop_codon:yes gene_type:complete